VALGENIKSERPPAILPVFFVNKYKSSLLELETWDRDSC